MKNAASLEEMMFDKNLMDFSARVSIIYGLEHNGKISCGDAFSKIRDLFSELERSKEGLLERGRTED